MAKITQIINMFAGSGWNAPGTSVDTYQSMTALQTRLNIDDFDGTITVYFECNLYNGTGGGTTTAQLYNQTDSSAVTGSEVTSTLASGGVAERKRSGAITLSGDKDYIVRLKHSVSATRAQIYGARIIIVQEGTITKTQVHIEIGNEQTTTSTSNTNRPTGYSKFLYEASKYNGTVTVRHDAILKAPASQTITSGIYDETAASVVSSSEVNTTNSSVWVRQSSSNITLTDGHVYKATVYVTGGSIAAESNKLVITLTGSPTKFLAMWMNQNAINNSTTSTSYVYNHDMQIVWDTSYFDGATVAYYVETNASINNSGQTSTTTLYDYTNSTDYSGGTNTNTGSTTNNRVRSSALTPPGSAIAISAGIKSSGSGASASIFSSFLVVEVSNLTTVPNYSREAKASLPTDNADLATVFNTSDRTAVATDDNSYVTLRGAGYLIKEFKDQNVNNTFQIAPTWKGKARKAPSLATVYLQVYNYTDDAWETIDSDNSTAADTEFTLTGSVTTSLSEYYDDDFIVTWRVYQQP